MTRALIRREPSADLKAVRQTAPAAGRGLGPVVAGRHVAGPLAAVPAVRPAAGVGGEGDAAVAPAPLSTPAAPTRQCTTTREESLSRGRYLGSLASPARGVGGGGGRGPGAGHPLSRATGEGITAKRSRNLAAATSSSLGRPGSFSKSRRPEKSCLL